jgi:hypothetical protein
VQPLFSIEGVGVIIGIFAGVAISSGVDVTVEFMVGVREGGSLVGASCVGVGSGVAWTWKADFPSVSGGVEEGAEPGLDCGLGVLEMGLAVA